MSAKTDIKKVAQWLGRRPVNLKTIYRHSHIGRNDRCPCGSGMKYKYCCGKQRS